MTSEIKKIPLIILGSARQKSETKSYVDFAFDQTEHKLLDLLEYNISSYNYNGIYPSSDSFNQLTAEILNHDIIIFATPVYWYSMSGLMKNVFDRFTDLVTIQKATGRKLKNKTAFLLAVGADQELPNGFEIPFQKTAEYLEMNYSGCVYFSINKKYSDSDNLDTKRTFIEMVKRCTYP
jgi:multimeric flavodoxin WrbA